MTSEQRWGVVWGAWAATFVVAEAVAIKSGDPNAPLSHHLRKHTHILGKHAIGKILLLAGADWLHRHLYVPVLDEARQIEK